MLVYRIEEFDGKGLYQNIDTFVGNDVYSDFCNNDMNKHPTPYDLSERKTQLSDLFIWGHYDDYIQYSFGFSTTEQMVNWMFGGGEVPLKKLIKCNQYYISIYETADKNVKLGNYQCAFIKEKAVLVDQRYLSDIYHFKRAIL